MAQQPRKSTNAENPAKKDDKQLDTQALGFNSSLSKEKRMENPYLANNGKSYDKSEIDDKRSPLKLILKHGTHPNAVLKQAMETYTQHTKKLAETIVAIEAAQQQAETQREEMQQLDLRLTAVSPGDLTWQHIQSTSKVEAPAKKEIKATRIEWEAIEQSFECAYSTAPMKDPIFCVDDSCHYNAEADGQPSKTFLPGKKTIRNLHFKDTIAKYPRDLADSLITQLQKLEELQQQLLQDASILAQKNAFLLKKQPAVAAPIAMPAIPLETPGGPRSSPYKPDEPASSAVADRPRPSVLSHAAVAPAPTPGAGPSSYRPAAGLSWEQALNAVDGNDFAKLIETADSKALTSKINGLSLAEYLALYSPWPPLPSKDSNKDLPNKKALLHKLLSKGIELAPLLKAATLGDHMAVKDLMKKKPKPHLCDNAGHHFLHYAVSNDFYNKQKVSSPHKALIAEWRKQFPDEVAAGEDLLAQQPVFLQNGAERFFQAIQKGDKATVIRLLEAKISPNIKNSAGCTPLIIAVESKRTEVVKTLVEAKAIVNVEGEELEPSQAPLHYAVIRSENDILNILLTAKADITKCIKNKNTALHLAVRVGNINGVNMLLEAKASSIIDAVGENGHTPLHEAARRDFCPVIELLINHKANIDSTTGIITTPRITDSGVTPLIAAANAGKADAVQLLIAKRANVNIATKTLAITALLEAIMQSPAANQSLETMRNGHQLAAIYLINARANVEAVSVGYTPLLMAIGRKDLSLVTKLIMAQAAPNHRPHEGSPTPLELALSGREYSDNTRKITDLLKTASEAQQQPSSASFSTATLALDQKTTAAPSSTSAFAIDGEDVLTPQQESTDARMPNLREAKIDKSLTGNTDKVKAIVEIDGETPLGKAVKNNHTGVIKALLDAKEDVNQLSAGTSLVLLATNNNQPEILQQLIDAKAIINIEGEDLPSANQSPLHYAAFHSKNLALQILLAAKADIKKLVKTTDTTKDTALHLAASQGNTTGVSMLLEAKASVPSLREANNSYGYTPLHDAAEGGHTGVVELLIQSKADINALSKNAEQHRDESVTPLLAAAAIGETEVVEQLIAKKANMEIATKRIRLRPLITAILNNHIDTAIALIDAKADLEVTTARSSTALYTAVSMKNVVLIKKLLTARADPNTPAAKGQKPLELASERSKLNPREKPIENLLRAALKLREQPQSASSSTLMVTRDQKTLATQSSSALAPRSSQPSPAALAGRSMTKALRKESSDLGHDAEPQSTSVPPNNAPQPPKRD